MQLGGRGLRSDGAWDRSPSVLFNKETCSVVPPGVAAAIMNLLTAVAEYPREGNLYLAEVELSSFTRPAQDQ